MLIKQLCYKSQQNMKQSFIQTYCSNNHVLNPYLLHLNTAEPVLQLYSDEAADHSVHLHLSLPSLINAVRLNLIMEGKATSRLSLPECTERMRKTMMTPPYPTIFNKSRRTCGKNKAAAPSAPNIYVPALYENNYM